VDDLIATGGTLKAAAEIVTGEANAELAGFAAVIGLPFLGYEKILDAAPIRTIINYQANKTRKAVPGLLRVYLRTID
jgi:adenine phosphoribosyltransferase